MNLARFVVLVCLLTLILSSQYASGTDYINVSNAPFATVSNGPQNAIVVDVADPLDKTQIQTALRNVLPKATRASGGHLSRQIAALRKAGLIRPDVDAAVYPTILIRSGGSFEPLKGRAGTTYGGGTITFTYTGWSDADKTLLQTFAQTAYPIIEQIYGSPAKTLTVEVVNDVAQSVTDSLLGGVYITGAIGQPQIRLYRYRSNISLERSFLHTMIRAFHDTAMFDYDAWEEGFARAAAVAAGEKIDRVIVQNPALGLSQMDFTGKTGSGDAFYYVMSNYELMNQPPLSNNTFYTSMMDMLETEGMFGGMIIPRLGMSSTAWMKVYIERLLTDGQSFFKLFNETYYQQLSSNSGLAGNVPALKSIAASITPTVEGVYFDNWFGRQFIFDTSVSIGRKLYCYTFPPTLPSDGDDDYSMPVFVIYYSTDNTGGIERPLSGMVYPVYWNYKYTNDLFTSSQYEQVPIQNGEGYVMPTFYAGNIGGAQRVAMEFTIGTESRRVYFPVGVAGTETAPNNLVGVVVGTNSGSITARMDNEATGSTVSLTNGAFGAPMVSLLDFHRLTLTYTPVSGAPSTRTANVGPGLYTAVMNASTTSIAKQLVHTFTPGTQMISFPMTTFAQDQSDAIMDGSGNPAILPDRLLLARWEPSLADSYKYEMYPKTPPFAPGRGYWIKLPSTIVATVTGEVPDPSGSYRIGLVQGWNQIGCPYESPVAVSSIMVEKENFEPVKFAEAWSTGIVGKTVWKYDSTAGYTEATTIDPWEGYWIKCNSPNGAVLIVPGPESTPRSRVVKTEEAADTALRTSNAEANTWSIEMQAVAPNGNSNSITLGVAPGASDGFDPAYDSELPPAFGSGTTIATRANLSACDPLGVDTRAAGSPKITWDMVVTPAEANQDIVIRWRNLANVPKGYRLTLVDKATGDTRFMRTTTNYRFNTGDGSSRLFTVVADSSPTIPLMITNVTVAPSRGSSASITYNLTCDAQVSTDIVGANGRLIRKLTAGRVTRSGINNFTWDKRDDRGEVVPAGVYTVQIAAVTESGEMVKTVRSLMLAR